MSKITSVKQLMTAPARTVRSHESLFQAAEAMWEGDCGGIPVVSDEGQLAGFVTDRDVTMCAAIQGRTLHELPVTAAMTFEATSVGEQDSLEAAHELLRERRVRRLPVVDKAGAVVGMLSLVDLVRDAAANPRARTRVSAVRDTLIAVSQPVEASGPTTTATQTGADASAPSAGPISSNQLKIFKAPARNQAKASTPSADKTVKAVKRAEPPKAVKRAEPPKAVKRAEPPKAVKRAEPPKAVKRVESPKAVKRSSTTDALTRKQTTRKQAPGKTTTRGKSAGSRR